MKWLQENIVWILIIIASGFFIWYVLIPFLKGVGTGAAIGGGIGAGALAIGAAGALGAGAAKSLSNGAPESTTNAPELPDPDESVNSMFENAMESLPEGGLVP